MKRISFAIGALLVLALPAGPVCGADRAEELPLEAALGDRQAFTEWRGGFESRFRFRLDGIGEVTPSAVRVARTEKIDGFEARLIVFDYPDGSPLHGKPAGGVLALPERPDSAKPLLIAIHGHEHPEWGRLPVGLFSEKKWPWSLVKAGYAVWAPVSMYHSEITGLAGKEGYLLSWVKIISEGLNLLLREQLASVPHRGSAVLGLSAGGQTAYTLMAARPDIGAGIFAGSEQPLDFLRREYHLRDHPRCWDIPGFQSYLPIQALIAPRPVQFQMGRKDSWYPSGEPFPKHGDWFPGTSRDVLSDEIAGAQLIRRSIWSLGGGRVAYHIHEGGHVLDAQAAIRFLEALEQAPAPSEVLGR